MHNEPCHFDSPQQHIHGRLNKFIDMYSYKCTGTLYTFQFDRGPVRQV